MEGEAFDYCHRLTSKCLLPLALVLGDIGSLKPLWTQAPIRAAKLKYAQQHTGRLRGGE